MAHNLSVCVCVNYGMSFGVCVCVVDVHSYRTLPKSSLKPNANCPTSTPFLVTDAVILYKFLSTSSLHFFFLFFFCLILFYFKSTILGILSFDHNGTLRVKYWKGFVCVTWACYILESQKRPGQREQLPGPFNGLLQWVIQCGPIGTYSWSLVGLLS